MSTAPDSLPGLQIKCVLFLTKALQIHPYFWDSGSTHCLVYWGRVRKDKSCSSPASPPVKSFLLCSGPWHVLSQHAARSCSLSPYQNSQTGLLSVPSKHDTPHGIFFFFLFQIKCWENCCSGGNENHATIHISCLVLAAKRLNHRQHLSYSQINWALFSLLHVSCLNVGSSLGFFCIYLLYVL